MNSILFSGEFSSSVCSLFSLPSHGEKEEIVKTRYVCFVRVHAVRQQFNISLQWSYCLFYQLNTSSKCHYVLDVFSMLLTFSFAFVLILQCKTTLNHCDRCCKRQLLALFNASLLCVRDYFQIEEKKKQRENVNEKQHTTVPIVQFCKRNGAHFHRKLKLTFYLHICVASENDIHLIVITLALSYHQRASNEADSQTEWVQV